MITRYLKLTLLMLCACGSLMARTIDADAAKNRVTNALQRNVHFGLPAAREAGDLLRLADKGLTAAGEVAYYAFDCQTGGYIITSADDEGPAILARIPDGKYNAETMPPAMKAWLAETAGVKAKVEETRTPIYQLLDEIVWSQDKPFNNLCPKYPYQGYDYETYAGCAAIAMGQIMRHYQHPKQGEGSVEYETYSYYIPVSVDFSSHTYDWDNILPNYLYTSYDKTQAEAVAFFVNDIACAIRTDFTPTSSSTQDFRVAQALKYNFGYDRGLQLIDHGNYSTQEWSDIIYAELAAKRPVYLSGCNDRGGHAFVVDGYKGDGLFHINWGWNGTDNGDYYLTELKPKNQGTGGNGGGYAFMQNAIIGIQPDMGNPESPAALALRYEQIWLQHDEDGDGVYAEVYNPTATDFEGLLSLRVRDGEELLVDPDRAPYKTKCLAGWSGTRAWAVDFPSLQGKEGLVFEIVYKVDGQDEWQVAHGRLGSPRSLVTFKDQNGNLTLGSPNDELFKMRLVSLEPLTELKPNETATLRATVRNESDYEYFAPLYLFVQDGDGYLVNYSAYDLHIVPAHGEATYDLQCIMPKAGQYLFSVAYEYLGYNYDYTPMVLSEDPSQKGYTLRVGKEGGEDSTVELLRNGDVRSNATADMSTADKLVLDLDLVNKGGKGAVSVFYQIVNPYRWSEVFAQGEPSTYNLDAGETFTHYIEAPLTGLAEREYEIIVQWQRDGMVLPRNAGYVEFAVTRTDTSGLDKTEILSDETPIDLSGRRTRADQRGVYILGGRKVVR